MEEVPHCRREADQEEIQPTEIERLLLMPSFVMNRSGIIIVSPIDDDILSQRYSTGEPSIVIDDSIPFVLLGSGEENPQKPQ